MDSCILERVNANIALAPQFATEPERLAARHFFSFLAHVELAAVDYAERGLGTQDQVADELCHFGLFKALAENNGGLFPCKPSVVGLLDYMRSLNGMDAQFAFGLIGEEYIGGIFTYLSGRWEMFEVLAQEEQEHSHFAMAAMKGQVDEEVLREAEFHIQRVASDPYFLAPLSYLIGIGDTARLGLQNAENHRNAIQQLGLEPGQKIEDVERMCRSALRAEAKGLPSLVPLNGWERSKLNVMQDLPTMHDDTDLPIDSTSPAEIEAQVVRATARILARHPRMNRAYRARNVYSPAQVIVGVRRAHDALGQRITTVYLTNPHLMTLEEIRKEIKSRLAAQRERPYREVEDYKDLEILLPAPRAAALVTQTGQFGVRNGKACHIRDEGAAITINIGRAEKKPFPSPTSDACYSRLAVNVGYQVNHILWDGKEIGTFTRELEAEFNKESI